MSFSRGSTLSVISSIPLSILGLKMWPNTALEPTRITPVRLRFGRGFTGASFPGGSVLGR